MFIPDYSELEKTLGLTWPVKYVVKPHEHTCRINCDPVNRRCEVWLHEEVLENPKRFLPDIAHELCHVWLGEHVDPCFATVFFSRQYGKLEGKENRQFEQKARQLYAAHSHIDIWVNELRHRHFPALTSSDQESFIHSVKTLAKMGEWDKLRGWEGILGIAMCQAEAKRFGLEQANIASLLHGLGEPAASAIRQLWQYYDTLPALIYERSHDVAVFERTVQETARLLQLPITPRLVEESGIMVWLID